MPGISESFGYKAAVEAKNNSTSEIKYSDKSTISSLSYNATGFVAGLVGVQDAGELDNGISSEKLCELFKLDAKDLILDDALKSELKQMGVLQDDGDFDSDLIGLAIRQLDKKDGKFDGVFTAPKTAEDLVSSFQSIVDHNKEVAEKKRPVTLYNQPTVTDRKSGYFLTSLDPNLSNTVVCAPDVLTKSTAMIAPKVGWNIQPGEDDTDYTAGVILGAKTRVRQTFSEVAGVLDVSIVSSPDPSVVSNLARDRDKKQLSTDLNIMYHSERNQLGIHAGGTFPNGEKPTSFRVGGEATHYMGRWSAGIGAQYTDSKYYYAGDVSGQETNVSGDFKVGYQVGKKNIVNLGLQTGISQVHGEDYIFNEQIKGPIKMKPLQFTAALNMN